MSAIVAAVNNNYSDPPESQINSITVDNTVIKWSNPPQVNVEPGATVNQGSSNIAHGGLVVSKTNEIEAKQNEAEVKTREDLNDRHITYDTWDFKSSFTEDASEMIGNVASGGGKAVSNLYKGTTVASHVALAYASGGATLIALPLDYYLSGFIGKIVGNVTGAVVGTAGYTVKLASMSVYNGVQSIKQNNYNKNKERYEQLLEMFKNTQEYKDFTNKYNILNQQLNDLKESEQEFFKKKYFINDGFGKSKRVMLIGPTRFGKSTLSNKLLGKKETPYKLSKLSDNEVDFPVGKIGTNSTTKHLKGINKIVELNEYEDEDSDNDNDDDDNILNRLKYRDTFILNIIDTPGAFDINGKTDAYMNEMLEFGQQFGGIHMFIIVFRFNSAFEQNYKILLENYQNFWGNGWWKHCVIAITHCDKDTEERIDEVKEGFDKSVETIKNGLSQVNNRVNWDKLPIIQFGKQNFNESIKKLFYLLSNNENSFYGPYKCNRIRFPIDDAWDDVVVAVNELKNWEYYQELMELENWLASVHDQY